MLKDIYNITPRETIRDRNWIMPFGKFKGTALSEIIENDPQYIEWLVSNTDLDFHSDIMDEVESDPRDDPREYCSWAVSKGYF